jgi:hypothetical protein
VLINPEPASLLIQGDDVGAEHPFQARDPADVLARVHHRLGDAVGPALVVAKRLGDDPRPAYCLPGLHGLPESCTPALEPFKIVRFPGFPLRHVRQFDGRTVRIPGFEMNRFIFESGKQVLEILVADGRHVDFLKN